MDPKVAGLNLVRSMIFLLCLFYKFYWKKIIHFFNNIYFQDYLLCSHLCQEDFQDVFLFLKYHCILHLVNKQPVDDLVIWREVFLSRLCHMVRGDNPGYREPKGRWFLLVVSMVCILISHHSLTIYCLMLIAISLAEMQDKYSSKRLTHILNSFYVFIMPSKGCLLNFLSCLSGKVNVMSGLWICYCCLAFKVNWHNLTW